MQLMPTHRQATAAISSFFQRINPLLHVLHRPSFEAQCEGFWKNGATNDGRWLATYLGVCGNGLLAMSEDEAAASSMPTRDGKGLLVRSWIDGALQALCSEGFAKNPSLEGLRAVVLLNMFWASWDGGKHLEAAITFNMTAISTVWELELPRDPDELNARFTPLEAEERRRVFWALFSLDTLARSFLGKTYHPHDAATISCRFPAQLPDEAYSVITGDFDFTFATSSAPSTMKPVVSLHSVCLLLSKISKATASSGSGRPSSVELVALHEELEALDTHSSAEICSHPSPASSRASSGSFVESFSTVLKSFAEVKLARGFAGFEELPGGYGGDRWRKMCTKHATLLLTAIDSAPSRAPVASLYTSLACWSSAITLSMDMIGSPFSTPDDTLARLSSLRSASKTTRWPGSLQRVFLRGGIILQQLAEHEERKKPSGLTAPLGSFFGLGHTNSPSSSNSGFDNASMVDTPFFLPQGSSNNYLRAEQYLSPLPYAESFSDNYYQSSNLGGEYAPTAPSHSNSGSFDSYSKREDRQLAPLLKPWLASTATLVSPLTEFNMASWSRSTALDSFA
ncbi:hypothetical protein BCR35DRAFT_2083 [Leucosporidium creatinivorum]|uniref:Xylanolytic transcriptional activator regulatory domain-containing protein n=1 Tax=Leucosporidium creatinivorum TaxID=106004 RepID=A0A1Y2G5Y4_9BASI|nr:hypothetical protein BCR35DRAFT_2083 [Leucosporidium creatinivorum]